MTTAYALATVRHAGAPTPVIEVDGRLWPIAAVAPDLINEAAGRGLLGAFDAWPAAHARLSAVAAALRRAGHTSELPAPGGPGDFLSPLLYPAKLIMMGMNYPDHVANDAGIQGFDKSANLPTLFMKPPTTALVGGGPSVPYPIQTKAFDWEIELAVVIGTRASRVTTDGALAHVAGYTIGIDLSARDWQRHPRHVVKFDLFGGKAFDNSNPLGPRIVPAAFFDPADAEMTLELNGEVRQHARTRQMIWSIAEQIAAITEHVTLEPGDVVMTGTPSGIGATTGTYLKVGDRLDARIEGLGVLTVEIAEPAR